MGLWAMVFMGDTEAFSAKDDLAASCAQCPELPIEVLLDRRDPGVADQRHKLRSYLAACAVHGRSRYLIWNVLSFATAPCGVAGQNRITSCEAIGGDPSSRIQNTPDGTSSRNVCLCPASENGSGCFSYVNESVSAQEHAANLLRATSTGAPLSDWSTENGNKLATLSTVGSRLAPPAPVRLRKPGSGPLSLLGTLHTPLEYVPFHLAEQKRDCEKSPHCAGENCSDLSAGKGGQSEIESKRYAGIRES